MEGTWKTKLFLIFGNRGNHKGSGVTGMTLPVCLTDLEQM